ncbi:MAG: hypothetical protein LRS43_00845 [Desulfurococcales archaeon]|nr:hypothetical protein [Desulfurococcales archaeon]
MEKRRPTKLLGIISKALYNMGIVFKSLVEGISLLRANWYLGRQVEEKGLLKTLKMLGESGIRVEKLEIYWRPIFYRRPLSLIVALAMIFSIVPKLVLLLISCNYYGLGFSGSGSCLHYLWEDLRGSVSVFIGRLLPWRVDGEFYLGPMGFVSLHVMGITGDILLIILIVWFLRRLLKVHIKLVDDLNSYLKEGKIAVPLEISDLHEIKIGDSTSYREESMRILKSYISKLYEPFILRSINLGLNLAHNPYGHLIAFLLTIVIYSIAVGGPAFIGTLTGDVQRTLGFELSLAGPEYLKKVDTRITWFWILPGLWGPVGVFVYCMVVSYFTSLVVPYAYYSIEMPLFKPIRHRFRTA